jgi:hypothetical protein
MLQHNEYSDGARAWMIEMLGRILEENLSPVELRRIVRAQVDGIKRSGSIIRVTKRAGHRKFPGH